MKIDQDYRDIMYQARRAVLRQTRAADEKKKALTNTQKQHKAAAELAEWIEEHTSWSDELSRQLDKEARAHSLRPVATALVQQAYTVLELKGVDFAKVALEELNPVDDAHQDPDN